MRHERPRQPVVPEAERRPLPRAERPVRHPDDVIKERGYETIYRDDASVARLKGLKIGRKHREPKTRRLPGLLVPMYRPTGAPSTVQFKPLQPWVDDKGKGQKYISPHGSGGIVDVLPRHAEAMVDPTVTIWVVEGAKKADCLASRGIVAITLPGVWRWRNLRGPLGMWEEVQLKGRRQVVICFDSDAATNPQVAKAMDRDHDHGYLPGLDR